jgi:hypothetical protein
LYFAHDAQSVEATGAWYYNFEYDVERERGLDFQEDLYNPFTLSFDLDAKPAAAVIASIEPRTASLILTFAYVKHGKVRNWLVAQGLKTNTANLKIAAMRARLPPRLRPSSSVQIRRAR